MARRRIKARHSFGNVDDSLGTLTSAAALDMFVSSNDALVATVADLDDTGWGSPSPAISRFGQRTLTWRALVGGLATAFDTPSEAG